MIRLKKYKLKRKLVFLVLAILWNALSIAQTRNVLIEQFSNASCPNCGQYSPQVYNFADNNSDLTTVISYHTSFPHYDSLYLENASEVDQRVNYYTVVGVPNSVVDGNVYDGASASLLPTISTTIGDRVQVAPKYTFSIPDLMLNGEQLSGILQLTSMDNLNSSENLVAHVVVIEKDVQRSSYVNPPGNNVETHYEFVMRKMLPDANGTLLVNKQLNGVDQITIDWTLNHIRMNDQVRVVVFVQNNTTKEIYQAEIFTPQLNQAGIQEQLYSETDFTIYPNPSRGSFTIDFNHVQWIDEIMVINQLGEVVAHESVHANIQKRDLNFNINPGIYYVKSLNNSFPIQKISILN